jgi:hypothetical protein
MTVLHRVLGDVVEILCRQFAARRVFVPAGSCAMRCRPWRCSSMSDARAAAGAAKDAAIKSAATVGVPPPAETR